MSPLPSYRGKPNLTVVAREAGIRLQQLKSSDAARTELDQYARSHGIASYSAPTRNACMRIRIEAYVREKKCSGGTIPRDSRQPDRPSHVGVAEEMGVDYAQEWASNRGLSAFITRSLKGLPLGSTHSKEWPVGTNCRDVHRDKVAAFDAYLRAYEDSGTPLPESLNRPGFPNLPVIRAEHRIAVSDLNRDTPFRKRLDEAIKRVGLKPRLKPIAQRITYEELLAFAVESRQARTSGTATGTQSVANLVSAGRKLMAHLGRSDADFCDIDLTTDLEANLEALSNAAGKANTARKLRAEIRTLAAAHRPLLKRLGLPDTFPKALAEVCVRAGIPYAHVEHRLNLVRGTVSRWACDINMPSISSLGSIGTIEAFFDLPAGSLTTLLPRVFGRRTSRDEGPSLSELHGSHVVRHLPANFSEQTQEAQASIVAEVKATIMVQNGTFSKRIRTRTNGPRLEFMRWPEHARAEWEAMHHGERNRPCGDEQKAAAVLAGNATADRRLMERFYAWALLPSRTGVVGGLGLSREALCIGLLAVPGVVGSYVDWCLDRRGGRLTKSDFGLLTLALSFLSGPAFAINVIPRSVERLQPLETPVTAHFIENARADWATCCAVAGKTIRELSERVEAMGVQSSGTYRLKLEDWPTHAQAEWKELRAFKEGDLPPFGKERADDAAWGPGGAAISQRRLEMFFGYALLPSTRSGQSVPEGGPGFPLEAISLALLAIPSLIDSYIRWCQARREGKLNKADFGFLLLAASLVREREGPIYQMPELADRLQPHGALIKAALVVDARENWGAFCTAAERALRKLSKQVKARMEQTRDPLEPIKGILDMQHPRAAYQGLIIAMDGRYPDLTTSPAYHHVHVRHCVMMRLAWATALRAKNLCGLTYKADGTGHLRKETDGRWVVVIPRRDFKNANGPYFGPKKGRVNVYWKVLRDQDGLYTLLNRYVTASRPFLLNGATHDTLLVSLGGGSFTNSVFEQTFRSVTAKHFAFNPHTNTGMRGVMPHGPHAIRHITATDIVKNTGRFDIAAYAIQDAEQSVRESYACFLTQDRQRLADEYLDVVDQSLDAVGTIERHPIGPLRSIK